MLYFYDNASIAGIRSLVRVPGPLEKLGQVMEPDCPSDGRRTMSFCSSIVPLDEGVTRCGEPQVCRTASGTWRVYFWVNHRPYLRYAVAESDDGINWEVADFDRPAIYHPLELGSWIWTPGIPPPVDEADTGPDQKALETFVPGPAAEWGELLHQLDADELVHTPQTPPQPVEAYPGFGLEEADPLVGDDLSRGVTWKGCGDLSSLKGKEVSIRIHMARARLFSIAI